MTIEGLDEMKATMDAIERARWGMTHAERRARERRRRSSHLRLVEPLRDD